MVRIRYPRFVRTALLVFVGAVAVFGCKKASTPDPLDGQVATASDGQTSEVEDLEADEAGTGKKGSGASGNANAGGGANAGGSTNANADANANANADGGANANANADGGANANANTNATTDGGANANGTTGTGGDNKPGDPNPTQPGAPAGVVEFIVQSVAGGTSTESVKAALEKSKQRFRGCYGKALGSDSSTSGVLKLRATIATDGVVDKVEVIGGNLGLSPLVQCSVAATKSMKIAGAAAPATKASIDVKFSK